MIDESNRKRPAMVGAGRPLGSLNRITKDLKQAMLDGLVSSDYARDPDDENAPGSVSRYMTTVANKHPELFFQAVSKLIPREIKTYLQQDTTVEITYHTLSEVKNAMIESGLSTRQVEMLENMLPVTGLEKETPSDEEQDDIVDILIDRGRAV